MLNPNLPLHRLITASTNPLPKDTIPLVALTGCLAAYNPAAAATPVPIAPAPPIPDVSSYSG